MYLLIIFIMCMTQLYGMQPEEKLSRKQIAIDCLNKAIEDVKTFQKTFQSGEDAHLKKVEDEFENRKNLLNQFKKQNDETFKALIKKLQDLRVNKSHFNALFTGRALIRKYSLEQAYTHKDGTTKKNIESAIKLLSDGIKELDPIKMGSDIPDEDNESSSSSSSSSEEESSEGEN